ncbi:aromatic amino acid beta-eliminating lyase/threonine aldolase [Paenibacillus curdlanolyticus YK9]|uniref:Aromatic amino acid beta-eliminating lyase/threonine aldolase n=1 Tax=Paenibacillus curdlanolyticus YK9 TaxID=717606 RepID=E0IA44_9BACL|nr:beta-eliminating lyase-related protein [Paenibacillus curdlanolyticus]EFM10621.1 aromatic amino acid beta-eliminating lyase/threonine aldolase [Paenibacillus curdlanolyticus YK9]
MKLLPTLSEVYNQASYPITGHAKRNVQVLKEALASYDGELDSDVYGSGAVIEPFQERMAKLLGKPAAVFFPSGTMAQQIALRIWSDGAGSKKVAYHPLCHLEIHEKDGLKELHHLEPILLADTTRPVRLADVVGMEEPVACVLLELPQREIGGQLPPYEELVEISAHCREKGIKLHLDGARLFEALPYYGVAADELCSLFDSVYISFYKGLGGIAGAVLAGEYDFTEESKVWKRRHGGDLISLYPYILSAEYYMERRMPRMAQYYHEAQELAALYNACSTITTVPQVPVSNMFHVHSALPKEVLEPILIAVIEETGFGFTHVLRDKDDGGSYYEVSIGDRYAELPKEKLRDAFRMLDERVRAAAE